MKTPILIINYKTYPSSTGSQAIAIAKASEKVGKEYNVNVMVAVPYTMIEKIASQINIPVLAQHVDPIPPGRGTGFTTVEAIREAGAKGSLVNHSEHKITISDAQKIIERLHENKLLAIGCGDTPEAAAAIGVLGADIIAMEPPELIGTGISVSKAKPETIIKTIKIIRETFSIDKPILVGAGVTDKTDAEKAIALGAQGILVASSVMKAKNPRQKIIELAEGLISGQTR